MGILSEFRQINKFIQRQHGIIFYSETGSHYAYFGKLINDLLENGAGNIGYITSDQNDPLLRQGDSRIEVIYCKWMLGFMFKKIRADVMILTMPDLDNYLFKRSTSVGHYVYVFHAMVSTHLQYRHAAFFNYDTIFCVGDYHRNEILKAEQLYQQKEKLLVNYGYPLVDRLVDARVKRTKANDINILIAPSWFEGCIFDTCIEQLLELLDKTPWNVYVRSHPEYRKRNNRSFNKITRRASNSKNINMDDQPDVGTSLLNADILITDRSGIAFEFALGCGKPVIFIETELKQNNSRWEELGIDPIENKLRKKLGTIIGLNELDQLGLAITQHINTSGHFKQQMDELRSAICFNSETSYKAGALHILNHGRPPKK